MPLPAVAVLAVCLVAVLGGCQAVEDARTTVDRTQDCATIVGKVAGINLSPSAAADEVRQAAAEFEQAIETLDNQDVKAAAQALASDIDSFQQALARTDAADVNRALIRVRQSAENLARTCNVPIDQLVGG
jgi:hypothetical protein